MQLGLKWSGLLASSYSPGPGPVVVFEAVEACGSYRLIWCLLAFSGILKTEVSAEERVLDRARLGLYCQGDGDVGTGASIRLDLLRKTEVVCLVLIGGAGSYWPGAGNREDFGREVEALNDILKLGTGGGLNS